MRSTKDREKHFRKARVRINRFRYDPDLLTFRLGNQPFWTIFETGLFPGRNFRINLVPPFRLFNRTVNQIARKLFFF